MNPWIIERYYDVPECFYGKYEATWLGGGRECFAHPDAHLGVHLVDHKKVLRCSFRL